MKLRFLTLKNSDGVYSTPELQYWDVGVTRWVPINIIEGHVAWEEDHMTDEDEY